MPVAFNIPPTISVGAGASRDLAAHARALGLERVLLVTDRLLERRDIVGHATQRLEQAGIQTTVYAEVQPDPTIKNVDDGLQLLRQAAAHGVIALGGGSPIDAAKAISVLATNTEPLSTYAGYNNIPRPGVPLIAVPTTAGTGSEVTKVAVITDTTRDVKMMIFDKFLLPAVAIVDYELSMSMPPHLTAHVGVDTLTHGIEAYVSRKAHPMSDALAESCIRLVAGSLERAWQDGEDRAAREAMALAACQGGMAFSNSSVALVHGMSRPIGALFHLPHGLSNAVLLPTITRFSLAGARERYATVARLMGYASATDDDQTACTALVGGIAQLTARLGIPRLRECSGINAQRFEAALEKMAQDALASGSPQNNPVVPTAGEIVDLYREAW